MNRQSQLWLITLTGIAIISYYNSLIEVPSPMITMTRTLALSGFYLLCISLIIGPLYVINPKEFSQLLEPRRAIGIAAFIFIALHYLIVITKYYDYDFNQIITDYKLAIAIPAMLILSIMTLTSNNLAVAKLGKHWKTIQRLVYIAFILSLAHFVMKANGINPNSETGLNIAEIALLTIAAITIIMQIIGFMKKNKAQKDNTKTDN
jgi:sulfoxide reductase heme-binding subunit YedZ